MPKNLQVYYNYIYTKKTKHKKTNITFLIYLIVFAITIVANNLGLLTNIVAPKVEIFKGCSYYFLILENNSHYSNSELQSLGCATINYNNGVVLNVYANKKTCNNVKKNLKSSHNLSLYTEEITLSNIFITNKNISSKNALKIGLDLYLQVMHNLFTFCEEFDKNKTNIFKIKNQLSLYKPKLEKSINEINSLKTLNLKGKVVLLLNSGLEQVEKINNLEETKMSSNLKSIAINFVLNFKKFMY